MTLRSQRSSQDGNSTADTADADANAQPPPSAQGSIGQASHRSQLQRQAAANSPKRPDLVDLVLHQMGRKDLFSKDTLKALRKTSRSFRVLIREVVKVLPIEAYETYGVKYLLKCPSIVPYMESFHYRGKGGPMEASDLETLVHLLDNSPRLNTLILDPADCALNTLSCIALPKLTCLELHNMCDSNQGLKELVQKQHSWPLQELSLDFSLESTVDILALASAVVTFSDLRKLKINGVSIMTFKNPITSEKFVSNALPVLKEMTVNLPCGRFLKLISGLKLPALTHLTVQPGYAQRDTLENSAQQISESLWLPQLQSLVLQHSILCLTPSNGSMEVMMAKLGAGALTKLTLQNWEEDENMLTIINLPNLEHLEITMIPIGMPLNFYAQVDNKAECMMTALATASLPNLHTLVIKGSNYSSLTEGDMSALAGAFLMLRSFSIASLIVEKSDMQTLIAEVLPQLEELSLNIMLQKFLICVSELGPSDSFPKLRKLVGLMNSCEEYLPSLAEHMPNLMKVEHHW